MASLHKNDVEDALAAIASGMTPSLPEDKHNRVDPTMEVEVQTDKEMVKIVGCRDCGRPLVVTTFFAPAKAICRICKGESNGEGRTLATVGVPIPGQTDPAKAVNLADCLVNQHFAMALCPVHPDDESHVMELKMVAHSPHYGPGEWTTGKNGRREYRQIAVGETVMHQCLKCNATVGYSTKQVVQFQRMNEVKVQPDLGMPHNAMPLGVRDEIEDADEIAVA